MEGKQSPRASQLQEAIDTIVQTFDYPSSVSVDYEAADGTKRTTFEVSTPEGGATYELVYDGSEDDAEPTLSSVE